MMQELQSAALAFGYEKDGGKRWDAELEFRPRGVDGADFADIADVAAAIVGGIRIENLAPRTGKWHADAIVVIHVG